jgi:4-hydroxy-2-oxoheptanedioate aldolase
MRENRLRTLWQNDQAAVNGWLAIPNSFSAETMAHQGWDTLTIDLQHGVIDYPAMVTMLQAISTTATVPIVRVPWLEPGIIMKTLDAGAYGVICPMVNTREDAQKFGHAQLRPGARAALRRRRLPASRQPDHRALRDDRNRAGTR